LPIYEYLCEDCGEMTEAMQKVSDPPLKICPKCKGSLKKVISNTSFILKGTGWYATDYANKGNGSGDGRSRSTTNLKEKMKEGVKSEESSKSTSEKDGDKSTPASKD
jgi:putative FmdB family regulatory protein